MKRKSRPVLEATKRTTVARRSGRSERGDTLVEVLISLVVLGTASVALLIAFSTSIASSGEHRNLTTYNTVLATASQEVLSAIDNQPQLFTAACSNNISQYPYYGANGVTLPAPYNTAKYTGFVQYVNTPTASTTTALPAVQYWNGSVFQSTCENNEPQLITIGISGTTYTNSFVVQYPIASTNNNASNPAQSLIFLQQPSGGYAGSPFTTQPIVEISNGSGAVSTDLSPVTLTLTTGTGVLAGCQGNEILGVVTFSGCTIGTGGTGFQITASDGNLTPAVSNPFNVTSSNFYLGFSAQPVAGNSGSAFTTSPTVSVYNTGSSPATVNTAWSGTVTFTTSGGLFTNCPGSTSTSDTVTVVNGVATLPAACDFSGGYFFDPNSNPQVTATQYTMTATATPNPSTNAAVPALSQTFSVSSFGPASQLYFSTEPTGVASASATTAFTGQPAVTVEDAFGNVVTSASNAISLTMSQGATGETLSNCSGTYNEGTDTFSGCNGTAYNTGLHLTATATGLSSATSTNFNITGVATQLIFTTSPVAGTSGSALSVQPALVFEDASNRVVTSTTSVVTLTVSPAGGTLSTCTGLAPNLGYVNVSNCTFTGVVGTPYTLTASAGGLTSSPSAPFSPTSPGVATKLVFSTQPVAGAAGTTLTTQPVVKVEDVAGNVVTSSTVSLNLTSSGGTLASCTGLTAAAGVVNVSNCTFGGVVATPYTMTATSGTLTPGISANFTPSGPGVMSQIVLTGCPANITVTTSCVITASLEDAYGNLETSNNSSVVSFTALTGIGSLTGFTNATATAGRATDVLLAASAGPTTFDASSASVTSNVYSMTVNAVPTISTTSLSPATQGQNGYNQTVLGTAGTTPYTWSISSGTLPTGLSINSSTGAITGNVSGLATTQTFTVTLTDADNVTATKSLSITVNIPPTISTSTLATATQNQTNYSQTLAGANGTSPYSWSVSVGSLPSGLALNPATGAISGIVGGAATTQTFTVTLTDANGVSASKSLTITVNIAPTISPSSLPGATKTGVYSQTLSVAGGTPPFGTWSLSSGTLPTGLTLNAGSGVISGTVSNTATTQTFTVQITDANGVAAAKTYTLTVNAAPSVTTSSLASATQNEVGYSQTLAGTGGTTPYAWTVTTGTLPTGLTLNAGTGAIAGTLGGSATTQTFTVTLTDANSVTATKSLTITVNVPPSITTSSLATATQNETGYSQTLTGTGGTTPNTWSITTGTLPTGLGLNGGTGAITGTLGGSATTQTFTVTLTDANGVTATKSLTITVNVPPSITTSSLPGATKTGTYNQTLVGMGGTTPNTWSITTGTLPTGLSLNAGTGAITGTVNAGATTQTFTVTLTDANGVKATKSLTITINAAPSVTTSSLATATQNETGYSQTLAGTGGTTPYAWTVTTGTLPTGLSLNAGTGAITGTLGSSATTQTFTVTLTDSDNVTATKSLTITVNVTPSISTSSLATATQSETGYSQTLVGAGGTTPYAWSISSGTLPTGLSLNGGTGAISGTVGAGATTQTFTVSLTDANGVVATKSLTITVNASPSITTNSLSAATEGQAAYSQTLAATGGTGAYTWSISSGTLPTGLSLNAATGAITGAVSGTATSQSVTFKVTDTNAVAATKTIIITVNAPPSITTSSLPNATLTGTYNQTVLETGGTSAFTWTISSGSLPNGLSINAGTGAIAGTVSNTATTQTFTVTVTDANAVIATKSLTITVNAVPSVTTSSLATATQTQTGYSQTLAGTGGTTPFLWTVTTGSLPTGLTLNAGSGAITGTLGGGATTQTFTVTLTDADNVTATKSLTITVAAAPSITTSSLPGATKLGTYNQTVVATGGTTPNTWSITTNILPAGLTLNAATGAISGTVSGTAVSETFTVTVTDSHGVIATKSLTITVNAAPSVSTSSLASATQGQVGYNQTLAGTGGTTPYAWTVTTGSLPTGLTLNAGTGAITGTVSGTATSQTFTVTLTDADNVTATKSLTITVNAAPTITTTTLNGGSRNNPYTTSTLAATGGTGAYTWTITSGILPSGLGLNAGTGAITGTVSGTAVSETFTVKVTDANGVTATKSLTITIS